MCDTPEKDTKDAEMNEFMKEFHGHGLGCGLEIARLAKEIHPNAVVVIPLYRSCVVIEQSEDEKQDGVASVHAYADPHWLGRDIDIEALKSDDFHSKFIIQGRREGPGIYLETANTFQKTTGQECIDTEKDIEEIVDEAVEEAVDKKVGPICQRLDDIIKFLKNSTVASSYDL